MCLVIYAVKCEVPKDELERDIRELKPLLDMKAEPQFPFTEHDIESALEAYDKSFVTFPRKDIERLSKIKIEPKIKRREKGKRLKQKLHLEIARDTKARLKKAGRVKDGRPPLYKDAVENYFKEHPNASVTDCASDLNIARTTVYRWKK